MVLKGLPVQYKPFEVVITQNVTDELTFHDFKVALRSFEDTEKARTSEKGDSLMLNNNGGITCFKCKELGHKANVCPKHTGNSKKSGKKRWCIHCKTNTHYTKYCRKNPGGGNNGGSQNDGGSGSSHSFVMMMRDIRSLTNNMDKSFLVDSGSTAHTVNSDEHFVEYDEEFSPQQHAVTLADGTTQTGLALKKGTIEVMFRDKSGKMVLGRLEGVLFIPSYPQNLFSVRKAVENNSSVTFHPDFAELVTKTGTKFDIDLKNGLYVLTNYITNVSVTTVNVSRSVENWHRVLGHCNKNDVLRLESVVNGMKISDKRTLTVKHV